MADHVSVDEAVGAMIAMLIVLVIFLIYFCFLPAYNGWKRRKQMEEELLDVDPQWETDRYAFQAKWPRNAVRDKKYSRLAACSRTSR